MEPPTRDFTEGAEFAPEHWIGVLRGCEDMVYYPWPYLVQIPPQELRTHALVIGSTGSGKTNLLHHLIAQDILLGHSLCVLDLRGDLVASVLELAADRVDPSLVRLIDLREKNRPCGYSPLAGSGEPYFRALNVLDVVASEADSWGVQLAETLRNALLLLAEINAPLTQLEALFTDRQFRHDALARCRAESVIRFWQRYEELSPDRQHAFALPVLNKISLLLSTPSLRKILGHPHPFDLGAHLNTPGSMTLVSLAVDEMHAAGRMMGRMILSSICREVFSRVQVGEGSRNPVRLYVDEFEHFGQAEFETILAEGRRFGLSLVLAHQTLSQLSPKMRSMILNNVGTKLVLRCGREDASVLCKDLMGDEYRLELEKLRVGDAVLWQRSGTLVQIQVNEPLLESVGSQSAECRAFVDAIYRQVPQFIEPAPPRFVPSAPPEHRVPRNRARAQAEPEEEATKEAVHRPKNPRPRGAKPNMEDWLAPD